jgi:hypothetical protein
MAMMTERLRERMKEGELERVRREIKMAMLIKAKQQRTAQAMNSSHGSSMGGFGDFKNKEDEKSTCLEKIQVRRLGLIYKRTYMADMCLPIRSRKDHAKRQELLKRLYGLKDEIIEEVSAAKRIQESL